METKVPKSHPCSLSCTSQQNEVSEPKSFFPGLKMPWEQFYRCQTERLTRIAAKTRVPPDQIADVLQEVWLAAVEQAGEFRGDDTEQRLSSWLAGVVRYKSIDTIRRLRRRRRLQIASLHNVQAEPVDHKGKEPAESMEEGERDESVTAKLAELRKKNPLNYRLVHAHVLVGRSLPNLAAETRLGVHAISCRIGRALKDLGGNLREWRPAVSGTQQPTPKVRIRKK